MVVECEPLPLSTAYLQGLRAAVPAVWLLGRVTQQRSAGAVVFIPETAPLVVFSSLALGSYSLAPGSPVLKS